jgi:hypothetical protein
MKTAQLCPRSLVASFIQRSATFERWLTSAGRTVYTFERIAHG